MKATEQYFPVVLFIMGYKGEGKSVIMEATQHYLVTKIPTDVRLQRILVLVISQCRHQLREQIYGQDPAKTNKTNKLNSVYRIYSNKRPTSN